MSSKDVLVMLAVAAVIGWFVPGPPSSGTLTGTFSATSDNTPKLANPVTVQEWTVKDEDIGFGKPEGAVLKREVDGHFYADAEVNGSGVHFLVDTGATAIALTGDDARSLGLHWNDSDLQPVARGASGPVEGIPVMLNSVELGGVRANSVPAAIIPEGLDVSLLGQSFLSRAQSIKINGDTMELN